MFSRLRPRNQCEIGVQKPPRVTHFTLVPRVHQHPQPHPATKLVATTPQPHHVGLRARRERDQAVQCECGCPRASMTSRCVDGRDSRYAGSAGNSQGGRYVCLGRCYNFSDLCGGLGCPCRPMMRTRHIESTAAPPTRPPFAAPLHRTRAHCFQHGTSINNNRPPALGVFVFWREGRGREGSQPLPNPSHGTTTARRGVSARLLARRSLRALRARRRGGEGAPCMDGCGCGVAVAAAETAAGRRTVDHPCTVTRTLALTNSHLHACNPHP